jgi:hypothetical protein
MTNTAYDFTILTQFPNGQVSSDRLTQEIQNSDITIALDHIDTLGDLCQISFKAPLSNSEIVILNAIVAAHDGAPLPQNIVSVVKLMGSSGEVKQNEDNHLLIAAEPRTGNEFISVTHNFCDPVSWFNGSIRANDQLLSSQDGFIFTSSNINWIDTVSGRIRSDDNVSSMQMSLNLQDPHGYLVIVKVDDVEKTICPIFSTTGGDYWVNYEDGSVVFLQSQAGKTVTASYSYASNSQFVLEPRPGYSLDIEYAEADFSSDVVMKDTLLYTIYGYVDVFAPELMPAIPSGTQIPIVNNKYKRYSQILAEAVGSYPTLVPNGSKESDRILDQKEFRRISRGVRVDSVSIPFRYGTKRTLVSSAGMKLVISTENDISFDGENATISLFGTTKEESV